MKLRMTNRAARDRTINSFDAAGQLTHKVWLSSNGTTNRTQTLYWDAKGRLWKVVERDSGNSGYDWTAVYDAFDRRLRTTAITVTNGVALTAQPKTINQFYDPMVEFLEVGVSYDSQTTWKLHGPDLNGTYGGMQGVGGFEAVQTTYSQPVVLISDVRGNVLQQYDTWTRSLTHFGARPSGYGAAPGYEPVALGLGASFGEATAWRGKWRDITGYYWLGKRYYSSQSGSWLSYDSAWNVRDPNWFTFCGDDPINYFDPSGRWGENWFQAMFPGTAAAAGARPFTGSTPGAVRWVHGVVYPTMQLPVAPLMEPHVQGGLKVVGGAVETGVGVVGLATTSETGLGAVVSGAAVLHGADTVQAGWRQMTSGNPTPSYTQQGITYVTGSPTAGAFGDAALGLGLTFGSSMLRVPAQPTTTWTTSLPAGFGETDAFGNMTLSSLGTGLNRSQAALHEGVHSVLSVPQGGILAGTRANVSMSLYPNSQFFRYTEEALAETVAQLGTRQMSGLSFSEALTEGLRFPLVNNYGISLGRVGLEAAGGTTILGGSMYFLGDSLSAGNGVTLGKKPH